MTRQIERPSDQAELRKPRRGWRIVLGLGAVGVLATTIVGFWPHSKSGNHASADATPRLTGNTGASAPVTPGPTAETNQAASSTPSPAAANTGPILQNATTVPELAKQVTENLHGMISAMDPATQQSYLTYIVGNPITHTFAAEEYQKMLGGPDGSLDDPATTINGYRFRVDPNFVPGITYILRSGTINGAAATLIFRETQPEKGIDQTVEFDFVRTTEQAAGIAQTNAMTWVETGTDVLSHQ